MRKALFAVGTAVAAFVSNLVGAAKVYATETGSVLGTTTTPRSGEVLGQNATNTGVNSILVWFAVIIAIALLIAVLIVVFRRNNNTK
ncbi:MAG: hypothetical protein QY314_04550 [Candidatus Dojkabacteria bacterium]|nr:MAG: hypothetical protein QY314_04550 [Candidatus Dojkabacteria bacterium]